MTPNTKEVAELIYAECLSGSAYWDELNGPDARLMQMAHDGRYEIVLPAWSDELDDMDHRTGVTITVRQTGSER